MSQFHMENIKYQGNSDSDKYHLSFITFINELSDPGQTSSSKTVNDEKTRILQKPPSGGARERERGDMDLYQGDRRTVSELLEERATQNGGRQGEIEMGVPGNFQVNI